MKKIFSTVAFILILVKSEAQTFEYGFGFQIFMEKGNALQSFAPNNPSNLPRIGADDFYFPMPTIDLEGAFNYPLLERSGFSIGVQPGLQANAMWLPEAGLFQQGARGDLFLTFRQGAQASFANYNAKRFVAAGAGYSFFEIYQWVQDLDGFNSNALFARPALFLETGKEDHKFKIYALIGGGESYYHSYTGNIPKTHFWEFGISWIRWGFFNND